MATSPSSSRSSCSFPAVRAISARSNSGILTLREEASLSILALVTEIEWRISFRSLSMASLRSGTAFSGWELLIWMSLVGISKSNVDFKDNERDDPSQGEYRSSSYTCKNSKQRYILRSLIMMIYFNLNWIISF